MADDTPTGHSLSEKLERLLAATTPKGKAAPTTRELAAMVTAAGYPVSHSTISLLLNGRRTDPSAKCVQALAKVFGVPLAYFVDDDVAEAVERDLTLLTALRDDGVRIIALGARGLSTGSQELVLNVIKQVRQLEGLGAEIDPAHHDTIGR